MAYYDFNGTVTIDEQAAWSDIQKIQLALPSLYNARTALEQLVLQSSTMQGETGAAITEKASELLAKINRLIQNLNDTSGSISQTVYKYQELDRQVKATIESKKMKGE